MTYSLYKSSSTFMHDILINNNTAVCTTPGATLVASFLVTPDLRTTERLMVATSVLMTILGIALFVVGLLGRLSGRPRGHSIATRIFFRASFALFLPFMSYMFSQAKNKGMGPRAQIIILWMLLVELLRKKVYAMVTSASDTFARGVGRYTFFDTVEEAARMVWIGYLIYSYVHGFGIKSFFIILWIFSVAKMSKRLICIQLAKSSFSVGKNASLVSGYMAQLVNKGKQHQLVDNPEVGMAPPHIMRTCNYVVLGEDNLTKELTPDGYQLPELNDILSGTPAPSQATDKKFVRVCDIWELGESDPLFRYNPHRRRKLEDICLGLALFKLIRRRLEHCRMAEANSRQALDIVLQGLLALDGLEASKEAANSQRAFDVVDLELTFLDEYYQAVIPLALPRPELFVANFVFSIVFILVYCVTVLLVTGNGNIFNVLGTLFHGLIGLSVDMVVQYKCFLHQVSVLVDMVLSSSDLIVTFLLTLTLFAVETYEFAQYLLSDWFVASVLCNYARKQSLRERKPVRHAVRCALWVKRRSRPHIKVHQFTMLSLHQLHPRKLWMLLSRLLKRRLVGLPDAAVTREAKLAIVRSVKAVLAARGQFSNGSETLRRHGFGDLSREWKNRSAAEVILVWHLATALFETRDRQVHPLSPDGRAAVTLSRYCAYLVAYEPDLLPNDPAWTEKAYKDMKGELDSFFRSCWTTVHVRERLIQFYGDGQTAVTAGVKLCKTMGDAVTDNTTTMQRDEKVWEMLSEFWAELLVFVARMPSAGAEAHAVALASGGEFITYIWSMLTHAGLDVHKNQGPTEEHTPSHV